jgi:hypothetical protein
VRGWQRQGTALTRFKLRSPGLDSNPDEENQNLQGGLSDIGQPL